MKTTLELDDDLLIEAEAAAVDPFDVVGHVVEQGRDVAATEGGVQGLDGFGGGGHGGLHQVVVQALRSAKTFGCKSKTGAYSC